MNKCKQCGQDNDLLTAFTKYQVCRKCSKENHRQTVGKLVKNNPDVPSEIYDIEASEEMAMLARDMGI